MTAVTRTPQGPSTKLIRGRDFDGWVWFYDNDPDFGTGLDSEVFDTRVRWAHGFERRGRFVRVKFIVIDADKPKTNSRRRPASPDAARAIE